MPVESTTLPDLGIVITRATGHITLAEIRSHQESLTADPEFDPAHHHLFDLSASQVLDMSTQEIRALASSAVFSPSSRRAVVAPRDATFGLSRMYEAFSTLPEGALRVFRSREEALAWLKGNEMMD